MLITSAQRWVLMHELRGEGEPDLATQLSRMSRCDLVLVEGYKRADIPKLEIHRPSIASRCCTPRIRTSWPSRPTGR